MNIKELVIAQKCRKGPAAGTTKRGAFWLAIEPIIIRCHGGDGVGNNSADVRNYLELRHYRSGEVRVIIHLVSWHQNSGTDHHYWDVTDATVNCETIEDLIVALKGQGNDYGHAYSDHFAEKLNVLESLGLPKSAPSPDEV